jgi:2-polyprenyl-3-methyl-5-hydroxy-6-metoxy-1,4-benzoquinol methylase
MVDLPNGPIAPFDHSGLATVGDLTLPHAQALFTHLESEAAAFQAIRQQVWRQDYRWPADPLHTWSRVWEYPYVLHHLQRWQRRSATDRLQALDVGCGATFFPFAVAKAGYDVTGVDVDPVCVDVLDHAARLLPAGPGSVTALQGSAEALPLADNAFDVAYSVSVLEHLPDPSLAVAELARVLRPEGLLVLTIDLGLTPGIEIAAAPYQRLVEALEAHFAYASPQRTSHPSALLHAYSGPYPWRRWTTLEHWWYQAKQRIKPLFGKTPMPLPEIPNMAVQGFVMTKRG